MDDLGIGADRRRAVAVTLGIGLAVVTGGVLGAWSHTGPSSLRAAILGFGATALAYLVVEELLREAHENRTSPWRAATFFAGFLPFFVAAMIVR